VRDAVATIECGDAAWDSHGDRAYSPQKKKKRAEQMLKGSLFLIRLDVARHPMTASGAYI
jgi:hypothetical protein